MPLARYRYVPDDPYENGYRPRLAGEADRHVESPVHRLQQGLAVLEDLTPDRAEERYPGWFRLAFPLSVSALMWAGILWGVGLIR